MYVLPRRLKKKMAGIDMWPVSPPILKILNEKSKSVTGVQQWPYKAVSKALEIIPRTLIQNCGANSIRVLTALRVKP